MAKLTLDIEELLIQTDAAKALSETGLKLIDAATDQTFQDGLARLLGVSVSSLSALQEINDAIQQTKGFLDAIPEPEDVYVMGAELYQLLCFDQEPFPRDPVSNDIILTDPALSATQHLRMDTTGKIRLMAWPPGSYLRPGLPP